MGRGSRRLYGDGRSDMVLGADQADNNLRSDSGSVYLAFGRAAPAPPGGSPPPPAGTTPPAAVATPPAVTLPLAPRPLPIARPPLARLVFSRIVTGLPSVRRCLSRRNFRIRLRSPAGARIASATVFVNNRRVRVVRGRRLTAPVDLRGLPRGRFSVKITVVMADGRRVSETRRYRTCARKRRR